VKIGIGVPNPVPDTPGDVILDWARRAEAAGFSGLVTIDRIAYPGYDSLTTLAAAAGATERISLMTNILLAPIYTPVLLAKTAASIDQISRGRLSWVCQSAHARTTTRSLAATSTAEAATSIMSSRCCTRSGAGSL
jgi:alkanesulfonate monooxygenase SsuD/methylene tetrahydromethanopterin reductase-like flavin-dependent oxidoreductase (luciferase family)